jgi:hypothetical protein
MKEYSFINQQQMRVRKALPAQRRPTIRVPAIDVFTTGITPDNSDSNTLYQVPYYSFRKST